MIADELLNLAARVLLRAWSPSTVHAWLTRIGQVLPQRRTPADVRAAASRLRPKGTCLTRALAVAARAPRADVVIGVRPEGRGSIHAHAWIEVEGEPLYPSDPSGLEIARLRAREATPSREARWTASPRS